MPRRWPRRPRATVAAVLVPGLERGSCCPGARRGDGTVRASDRVRPAGCPRRALRARLGAYVALTKPRIIELLLVTTVPVMVLAARGWPSGWTLLATLVGGTLAAVVGQHDQLLLRPRHRQADAPHRSGVRCRRRTVTPAGGAGLRHRARRCTSIVLLARRRRRCSPRRSRPARSSSTSSSTRSSLKRHTRRRTSCSGGAAGRGAGADRLGRGHRLAGLAAGGALRRRLLLARCRTSGRWRCGSSDDYARGRRPDAAGRGHPRCRSGRQTVAWAWVTVAVSLLLWPLGSDFGIGWLYTARGGGPGRVVRPRGAPPARPHPPRGRRPSR